MAKDPLVGTIANQPDEEKARRRVAKPKPVEEIKDAAAEIPAPPPITETELAGVLYGLSQERAYDWAQRLGIPNYTKMSRMRLLQTIAAKEGFPNVKFPAPQSIFEQTKLTRVSPTTGAPIPFEVEDYLNHRRDVTRYSQRVINAMESRCKEFGF